MYDFTEGRKERAFVWSGGYVDELIMQQNGTSGSYQKLYIHANHLFSASAVTDAAGAVVERYRYSAYGKQTITANDGITQRNRSAVGVRQSFTGRYADEETGLQYFRARQYDPAQGRFISRDPYDYIDGSSLYYSYFSPNYLDPFGLCCEEEKKTDSAGRKCCPNEMETVYLRNKTDLFAPHTYLSTPGLTLGLYPGQYPMPEWHGSIHDNEGDPYDNEIAYEVCPDTLYKLQRGMRDDIADPPWYTLGNFPWGRNCTGWACEKLRDAGIKPPNSPGLPLSSPYGAGPQSGSGPARGAKDDTSRGDGHRMPNTSRGYSKP